MSYEGLYQRVGGYLRSMNVTEFVPEFQELTETKYEVEVHLFGTQQNTGVTVDERIYFELLIPEMIFRLKD
jgi:hypothetical protein